MPRCQAISPKIDLIFFVEVSIQKRTRALAVHRIACEIVIQKIIIPSITHRYSFAVNPY
jgi:hypothetical protein